MIKLTKRVLSLTNQLSVTVATLLLSFTVVQTAAQAPAATKYKIDFEVSGEANASAKVNAFKANPSMVQAAGVAATFKIDQLRVSATASEPEGDIVMLDLKIELKQTSGAFTTSTPKLKVTLGTAANMALETDTGAEIELSIKVSKVP